MAASSWTMAMRRGMVDPGLSPWKGGENKSALNIAHYSSNPPEPRRIAIFLPQFFGSLSFLRPGAALFRRFNSGHGPKRALHKGIRDGSFKRQVQDAPDRRRFSRHAVRHVLYRRRDGIDPRGLCDADGGGGARRGGGNGARGGRAPGR